jgi:uncharacterized membrane protein YkoI
MTTMKRMAVAGLCALALGARAFAAESPRAKQSEAEAYAKASLSLSAAIALAERQTGAKAVEAKLENEKGALAFEVEVMKNGTFQKVVIDAQTGQVVHVGPDAGGHDDGEEDDD